MWDLPGINKHLFMPCTPLYLYTSNLYSIAHLYPVLYCALVLCTLLYTCTLPVHYYTLYSINWLLQHGLVFTINWKKGRGTRKAALSLVLLNFKKMVCEIICSSDLINIFNILILITILIQHILIFCI